MADNSEFTSRTSRDALSKAASGVTSAFRTSESVVYVDVGAKRIDTNIARDGVPIGIHHINQDILSSVIVDRPILQVRVVTQSIPAGTPVPVGAAVDLIMAPGRNLPIGVISGVHVQLQNVLIGEGYTNFVQGRTDINRIVTRAAAGQLTGEDEAAVRQIFESQQIAVTDEPGQDMTAAVETLRVLTTFGR